MESVLPFSFSYFPEDVQIRILSFLHPSDLDSFARTSKKFLSLCRDDERLWFLKCSRRWGSQTQIQNWGSRKISYRQLFHLLKEYENLIGFWHKGYSWSISPMSSPPLVLFEWNSFYITGYRISPLKCGGYGVTKKPFLWITATSNGKALNYLDRTYGSVGLTETDLLRDDSEKLRSELILVNVRVSGKNYLSVQENPPFFDFRRRLSTGNGRAEFESVYRCAPDGLMTRIYDLLAGKLSVTGHTKSKRERTREREREREKWRRVGRWDSQHIWKIIDCSPTPSRPLQGLWKGICPDRRLNFYLVSYREEWDKISCEKVGSSYGVESYRDLVFTASCTDFIESPYPPEEESTYYSRLHQAIYSDDQHVFRIFYANSSNNPNPSDLSGDSRDADGRIWVYTDGTFGFGFLQDDCIVHLKPMMRNGRLLDLVNK